MLGHYNALNALGALAAAAEAGVSDEVIRAGACRLLRREAALHPRRRMAGRAVYDDYAHHPVEIAAVLRAARIAGKGRVIAVVQPHRYTRLQALFNEFSACLDDADIVARHAGLFGGRSADPGHRPRRARIRLAPPRSPSCADRRRRASLVETIASVAKPGDVVVGLGAGTITDWINALPQNLAQHRGRA